MRTVLPALLVAIAAGCASVGSSDYSRSEARVVQTVAYGTIESVRPVRLSEDKPIVGTVAGAALGGLLGNSIGHGGGRAAATVIGAVGGGIAGNAIERHVDRAGRPGDRHSPRQRNHDRRGAARAAGLRGRSARARAHGPEGLARRARLKEDIHGLIPALANRVIAFVIVLVILGIRKLHSMGRDLGEAIRGFKDGVREPGEKLGALILGHCSVLFASRP